MKSRGKTEKDQYYACWRAVSGRVYCWVKIERRVLYLRGVVGVGVVVGWSAEAESGESGMFYPGGFWKLED